MKTKIILYLFYSVLAFHSSNTLYVTAFGATGNGITDDTNAINTALAAAASQQKTLVFPAGTYLCNKVDGSGNILSFAAGGLTSPAIVGQNAIIKTTKDSACTQLYIYAFSGCSGLAISGIFFQNTHGKITGITDAIFMTGTGGQLLTNVYVQNCRFEGFSQAVAGQGITGWYIQNNTFGAPQGHDNGQQTTDPCVGIWLFDNSNGVCRSVFIQRNKASGYTGTFPMACKRPLDGFVYGSGYGLHIDHNQTDYYSEEHFMINPQTAATDSVTNISNNEINCRLPAGSQNDDNSPHVINYGIRADVSNAYIGGNNITSYTYGIMFRGIDYPTTTFTNLEYDGNQLYAPTDTVAYSIQKAITITGSTGHPVTGIKVHGTTTRFIDAQPIELINTTGAQSFSNNFYPFNFIQ